MIETDGGHTEIGLSFHSNRVQEPTPPFPGIKLDKWGRIGEAVLDADGDPRPFKPTRPRGN